MKAYISRYGVVGRRRKQKRIGYLQLLGLALVAVIVS